MDVELYDHEVLQKINVHIISIIGFGISVLFLCTHLIVFSITEDMWTILGKNLASFCISLLLGYCTFIGSMVLQNQNASCTVVGVLMYYFFLTHSSWLLSISIEMWRSVKRTKSQRDYDNKNSWRFFFYSAFSWLEPALIIGAALYVEFWNTSIPDYYKPNFSNGYCRFGKTKPLLIFFVIPFAVNVGLNLIFSGVTLCHTQSLQMKGLSQNENFFKELKLYIRLSLIVAVTWITGISKMYFKNDILWIAFVVLNAAQTLYIFLVFTFNNKLSTVVFYENKEYDLRTFQSNVNENSKNGEPEVMPAPNKPKRYPLSSDV